jgi:hypothetical protein
LIKDTLNNMDTLQDLDVSDTKKIQSPLKSLVESQDDVTLKGRIYSPVPCRQIVRFFWNRLLLIFSNEILASNLKIVRI